VSEALQPTAAKKNTLRQSATLLACLEKNHWTWRGRGWHKHLDKFSCSCTCGPFEDLGLVPRPLYPYRNEDYLELRGRRRLRAKVRRLWGGGAMSYGSVLHFSRRQ
jgi:hypothetical protein